MEIQLLKRKRGGRDQKAAAVSYYHYLLCDKFLFSMESISGDGGEKAKPKTKRDFPGSGRK